MKKLIILSILIAANILTGLTFDFSASFRTPKDNAKPIDFEISTGCRIDSLLITSLQLERQDGQRYRNIELFAFRYWRFLQFSGKLIDIQEDDLRVISVDVRWKYKKYSIGVAEAWEPHPETYLVFGEDIRWSTKLESDSGILNLLANSIQKIEFIGISNFYTQDFQDFKSETELIFTAKLSAVFGVTFRYKQRYYDEWDWSSKLGIEIKI